MLGRGARPSENKYYFNVMDMGANASRLGKYRSERKWSLTHDVVNSEGVAPSKDCPQCDALIFASSTICKYCGYEFPKTKAQKLAELIQQNYLDKSPKDINFAKMTFEEIEEYALQKNYTKFWLHRCIYTTHGEKGLREFSKSKEYSPGFVYHLLKLYQI
jgi:DNA-directed RNA polymerase subunit M/transcription elongation factor TFIIS